MVTTTFPAEFIIVESSSLRPAAKTISFCTNWGGPAGGALISTELSVDDASLSSSYSDSDVSDASWGTKIKVYLYIYVHTHTCEVWLLINETEQSKPVWLWD